MYASSAALFRELHRDRERARTLLEEMRDIILKETNQDSITEDKEDDV